MARPQGRLIDYSRKSMRDHTFEYVEAESLESMAEERDEEDRQHIGEDVGGIQSRLSVFIIRESQIKLAQGPLHGYELSACEIQLLSKVGTLG